MIVSSTDVSPATSNATVSDTNVTGQDIDVTPPTGSILIDGGAASTNSTSATLTLTCSDTGSGCSKMQFSNDDITYSIPEVYAATKSWPLSSGYGFKTVYVKFQDFSGNWSSVYNASIILVSALDTTFNSALDGPVYATAIQPDGRILIGGGFTTVAGSLHNHIARLNADGSLDTSFNNSGVNDYVYSIAPQSDGKILAGGSFTKPNGDPWYLARFNPDGTLDDTFNPSVNGLILSIVLQPNGKILIGGTTFTSVNGSSRNYLARLNADGSLDESFSPNVNGAVYTVSLQANGKILIGGKFTPAIIRINTTGEIDDTFNANISDFTLPTNSGVNTIAVQADGKILISGDFTSVDSEPRNYLARLYSNGNIDLSFDPNLSPDRAVSIALQTDGKILIGGYFTSVGGTTRNYLALLNGDGSSDATFDPNMESWVFSISLQSDGGIIIGGQFGSGGASIPRFIGRLNNPDAATQSLNASNDGTTVTWLRGGASPEVEYVTFDQSTDHSVWTSLGPSNRIPGGWELTGQSLPSGQDLYIRARGDAKGGYSNASSSLIESITQINLSPQTFTISASAGPNGTIAPLGSTIVPNGGSQSYTINPNSGYHVADVLVDGVSQGSRTSYDFTNVTSNHTISATYDLLPRTISIAPSSPYDFTNIAVGASANQIFTISNSGGTDLSVTEINLGGSADYILNRGNGSGVTCGSTYPRTLTPGGSCTVAVTFQPSSLGSKTATLSVGSNDPVTPSASVAISGSGVYGTCNWTSVTGGNWTTASNWSCGHAPGTNDDAFITLAGTYTVTVTANTTVNSLTLGGSSGTQSLTVSGPLGLNNASTVGTYGALNLSGGTLAGSGTLSVSGTMNWTGGGGTMSGPGTTNITGAFNIDNGGYPGTRKNLTSRTLNIAGTATIINSTGINLSSATINNQTGASFSFPSDSYLYNSGGTNAFNNAGTVTKSAGSGTTTIEVPFTNTGTVNANSGTFSLALAGGGTSIGSFSVVSGATLQLAGSGTHTLGTGLSLTGAGTVDFYSGTVTVNCTYNVTGTTKFSGGTTTFSSGAAVSSVGSTLWVNGGTANFNNTQAWTDPTTLTVDGSSTANFNRGQALNIPTVNAFQGTLGGTDTLNVSNTLTWGRLYAAGGTMSGPGTTNITGAFNIDNGGYPGTRKNLTSRTLNIAGTATIINSTGINLSSAIINNQTGALFSFPSDSNLYNYSGTNAFNNSGTVTKSAGSGTTTIEVPFSNTGTVNANSGTLSLALAGGGTSIGSFSVVSGATLQFADSGTHTLGTGLSLTGTGTVDFYSGTVTVNCTYNVTGTTKVSGGTTTFGSGAAVSAVGSTLSVNGGTANFNNAQAWTDPTTLTVDGSSTANFNRGQALNIPTVNVFQGTLGGTDTLNVSNTLTWGRLYAAGGTMSGPGTTNITGAFNIDNGGYPGTRKNLTSRTLNIAGTATIINSTDMNLSNATINIQTGALFIFQSDNSLFNYNGTNAFNNAGTVTKSAGTGASTINVPFANTGTVNANIGTLSFTDIFTNSSTGIIQGTGTLNLPTGSSFTNNGAINPAAAGTAGKLTISSALTKIGVVNLDIGGTTAGTTYDQLAVSGAATLGGTLNVTLINGFNPSIGDAYTIMTCGSRTGTFGTLNLPSLGDKSWNTPTYNAGSLVLSVSAKTYTLTYAAGAGGTISGTTSQTVSYDANGSAVTAVPDTGYSFVNWSDSSTANPRTDTHVTADISLTANFALNTYTITAASGTNGTVTPSGATTVSYGGSQTYSITPVTGYHVADVLVDGVSAGAMTSYPFTSVAANHTISASFAINAYTLTYAAGPGGTISGTTPQTVNYGANGSSMTAVPNSGYYFVNWSDRSTANPRTDTTVTADVTVTANFVAGPPLQSTATPAGGSYNTAQTVTLTQIGGQPGAVIYYTTDNSDPTASSTLYTNPIAISTNTTLKFAAYAGGAWETPVKTEAYTFNANLGGSLPATISASVNGPIPITVTFDNQTGSAITTIKPDCFNTYFEVRDSQGHLLPSLCRIPMAYGIPKDVGTIPTGQSTLTCNLDEMFDHSVLSGLSGPYTVQATYSNYIQDPDLVNGTCQDPTNGCTALWTGAITASPATITLTNTFTLTYTAETGGSISGTSPQTVNPGGSGTEVTAVPNTGYHFVGWSDGVLTESRTDSNVTANISVTANFAIDTYTLTYAAGSGGTISGPTSQTINYGADGLAVTAVPDTGYYFCAME